MNTVILDCCTCGAAIHLPRAQNTTLRESHKTFYCSMGHQNYYAGKTEDEKKIEALTKDLAQARREAQTNWDTAEHWMNEASYHTCVFSRCKFRSKTKKKVREHMATCQRGKIRALPAEAGPDAHGANATKH